MYQDDGVVRGNEKNCVKLRGLPFSSTAENVVSFFGEYGSDIAPEGVHMVLNAMVRCSFSNICVCVCVCVCVESAVFSLSE